MDRRSFLGRSFLGLCASVILPDLSVQSSDIKTWNTPAVSMLHDGTRWRKVPELYIDPRCLEDIRNWGVDQIDEVTQKEIYENFNPTSMLGINQHM